MKRILLTVIATITLTATALAGINTPRFLGIPVDGPKTEMIKKLVDKGYKYNEKEDYLTGFYFGSPVYIFVQTVQDQVSRVIVYDIKEHDEHEIKDRFNMVYDKFDSSTRYATPQQAGARISDREKLAYEMRQHKKFYKAVFNQIKEKPADSTNITRASMVPAGAQTIDQEHLENSYNERRRRIHAKALAHTNPRMAGELMASNNKNQVWFAISEKFGKYALVLFYDNISNLMDEGRRTFLQ